MTRPRGRCPHGKRLIEKVSQGHWETTPLITALDHRGIRCSNVMDSLINGDAFATSVKTTPLPVR